jgi:hypothetical protein
LSLERALFCSPPYKFKDELRVPFQVSFSRSGQMIFGVSSCVAIVIICKLPF